MTTLELQTIRQIILNQIQHPYDYNGSDQVKVENGSGVLICHIGSFNFFHPYT